MRELKSAAAGSTISRTPRGWRSLWLAAAPVSNARATAAPRRAPRKAGDALVINAPLTAVDRSVPANCAPRLKPSPSMPTASKRAMAGVDGKPSARTQRERQQRRHAEDDAQAQEREGRDDGQHDIGHDIHAAPDALPPLCHKVRRAKALAACHPPQQISRANVIEASPSESIIGVGQRIWIIGARVPSSARA